MIYDAIVAGGGPAGSTTAAFLRKRGRTVLVLERERFPRFHLGESMLPFSNDLFAELGVLEEIDRRYIHKPGARIIDEASGATFTYYFDTAIRDGRPYAYQVPRADFDQLLLDNARRLGAEVREEAEVREVAFLPDRVRVRVRPSPSPSEPGGEKRGDGGGEYTVEALMFVDATGRDALLATERNLKAQDELVTTNVACFTHFADCVRQPGSDEGNFTLVMFDGGWWWFIPFKGNVTSVGVVFEKSYTRERRGRTPEQLFEGAVAEQREIGKLLSGATRVRPIGTTGNWSYRAERFYGDRFLLAGDAAAFIDPLFSTGVLMALNCGKFAAEAIDDAIRDGDFAAPRFADYQRRALEGADIFKKLVHEFYAHDLRRLLVASAVNPTMCAIITSLLAGDVYQKALWHGVVREGFSKLVGAAGAPLRAHSSRQARATKLGI